MSKRSPIASSSMSRTGSAGDAADIWAPSKPAYQPHEPPLDVDLVGAEDAGLVVGVGGLQGDGGALLAQALEGRLLLLDQGDDDVAVLRRVAALADDDVALVDAGIDHGIALDLEREMLASAHHLRRHGDILRVVLDGADRHAGGDAAHQRHIARAHFGIARRGRGELRAAPPAALDDI